MIDTPAHRDRLRREPDGSWWAWPARCRTVDDRVPGWATWLGVGEQAALVESGRETRLRARSLTW